MVSILTNYQYLKNPSTGLANNIEVSLSGLGAYFGGIGIAREDGHLLAPLT